MAPDDELLLEELLELLLEELLELLLDELLLVMAAPEELELELLEDDELLLDVAPPDEELVDDVPPHALSASAIKVVVRNFPLTVGRLLLLDGMLISCYFQIGSD